MVIKDLVAKSILRQMAILLRMLPVLVFLNNPNHLTGNTFSRKKIEKIISKTPGMVVINEAYDAFSGQSLLSLLKKYDNIIFLKTFSKLGLASVRLGFLMRLKFHKRSTMKFVSRIIQPRYIEIGNQ